MLISKVVDWSNSPLYSDTSLKEWSLWTLLIFVVIYAWTMIVRKQISFE